MRRKEKLELLYGKALEIFSRYGYKKSTVEDIAREIGLTKGGIYKYVRNKLDLYEKTVSHALGKWQDRVAEAMEEEDDITQKFIVMSRKGYEYLMQDKHLRKLLINDPTVFPYSSRIVRFRDVNRRSILLIQSLLRQGIKQNKFSKVNIQQTSDLLYSIYRMFIIEAYIVSDVRKIQQMYMNGINLILNGLIKR